MRKKTMTELRRAVRLARRTDAIKRAHGKDCDQSMQRVASALWHAKQEAKDEATTAYLNSVRDRIYALQIADPETQITATLNALADVLGVGR